MILFCDVETTGVEAVDRVCAVGLAYEDQTHSEIIQPPRKIPPAASAIHHITNEMAKEAVSFENSISLERLNRLNTAESIWVSHNAPFDLSMLQKEGFIWQGEVIDTLKCSKALMNDLDGYSLQFLRYECRLYRQEKALFEKYGLIPFPHHPLSDVLHTRLLFEYLEELAPVEELIRLSQERLLLVRLPFGKYASRAIEEIVSQDPGYLRWMLDTLMDLDEDLRYSIDYHLRRSV